MRTNNYRTASILVIISSIGLVSMAGTDARAQEDDVIEEIVVSAKFQRSLAGAIQQKQMATNQIEAIGLEDIGVLPAVSIADAIATLPGVAGARTDDGNIGQLSVRGTTDLALGLLNGREQVTVTTTRNVEYGLYPTNVMTAVQVNKSSMASLPEGGLSGTINMQTIKPLDFDETAITVNAELAQYPLSDDVVGGGDLGGGASVTYIKQVSDSFGLALAVSYANELLGRETDVTPFEWAAFSGGFGGAVDVDGDGIFGEEVVPQGFNVSATGGDETRSSIFAALQWQNDSVDVNMDLLVSSRDQEFNNYGVNWIGLTGASASLVNPVVNVRTIDGVAYDEYAEATITIPGTNASGFGSGGSSSFNQDTNNDQEILSTGLNAAWDTDNWGFSGDLSYSSAESKNQIFDHTVHLAPTGGFGGPTFTIGYSALGSSPSLSVQEDLLDPTIWVPRQFEELTIANDDSQIALKLDATRDLNDSGITSVAFGVRYAERDKEYRRVANRFNAAFVPDDPAMLLDSSFVRSTISPRNGPQYIAWDLNALASRYSQMIPQADAALPPPLAENTQLTESGSIEEDNLSAYVQIDFDTQWGEVPVSGNFGIRYAGTDLVAPGWTTPDQNAVPATAIRPTNDYSEVLPSFNITFDLTDRQKLRLGLAKVMNRAPLDDMRSSEAIFISGFGANGNAGNPDLDPTVANTVSLSYEIYPDTVSSIVLAGFYYDLDTFIGTEFVTKPVIDVGGSPVDVVFQTTANGNGGYIRGAEFSANSTFGFLSDALGSLGVSANYSLIDSNVIPVAPAGQGVALTGLSENVGNLALWWVGGNFEARIAWDYRSEYVEPGVFGNFLHVDDTALTSFQLSYDINENFRIGLFGRNISDEVRRKYSFNVPARTEFNTYYQETYGLKVFYQF